MNELTVPNAPGLSWTERVALLCNQLAPLEEVTVDDYPVTHSFEPGYYVREISLPAGQMLIGRPHRTGHRIVGLTGTVKFYTEEGSFVLTAPFEMTTKPGAQAVLITLTEHTAKTYHANPGNSRNVDELELAAFHASEETLALGREVAKRIEVLT